jgi:hypothetical protein
MQNDYKNRTGLEKIVSTPPTFVPEDPVSTMLSAAATATTAPVKASIWKKFFTPQTDATATRAAGRGNGATVNVLEHYTPYDVETKLYDYKTVSSIERIVSKPT